MNAKTAVWCLLVLMVAETARPDDGSAGPADAFRQVCEQAMPDLLRGDPKGFETLKSAALPEGVTFLEGVAHPFRARFERFQEDRGDPVDWHLVGAKRIGTMVRWDVYLCRYGKEPTFWCFRAHEMSGRWWLDAASWDSELPRAFDMLAVVARSRDPACGKKCDEVLDLLARGHREAAEALKKHIPTGDAATLDWTVGALLQESSKGGRFLKCELADVREIGSSVAEYCYALQWERGMKFFRFTFYRPAKDWKMTGFAFTSDCGSLLAQVRLEPESSSIPLQTAQPSASTAAPEPKALLR